MILHDSALFSPLSFPFSSLVLKHSARDTLFGGKVTSLPTQWVVEGEGASTVEIYNAEKVAECKPCAKSRGWPEGQ